MTQGGWEPKIGPLTERLIANQSIDDESKKRLVASAARTLGRCGSPESSDDHSGALLVVGEVQSGKTLAFTTLMGLGGDNGFRLIIVVAGTKTNLLKQTVERLKSDLLDGEGGINPWRDWTNPTPAVADDIRGLLSKPRDPAAKIDGSQTAVCFVLKHGGRLKDLRKTLEAIGEPTLRRAPTMIIDDEADQASLNLKRRQGERSAVNSAITEVRSALPRHDFLMYTATPQGPLLVALEDELSPETVTVLESGPDYVGGAELFGARREAYVREIPATELEAALEPESPSSPPPLSLREAVATFLLALVIAQERGEPRPLSMLIHPASTQDLHHQYANWAKSIRDDLLSRLADPQDILFQETVKAELLRPYEDLATTVHKLPALRELAERIVPYAQQAQVREVNQAVKSDEVTGGTWNNAPGWVLVGGNKLERGFTIKNLAITYMPRGPGVRNADTIQQRGRFFGYKRAYLDLCRGWFTADVAKIYTDYVEHEQAMHDALRPIDEASQPLRTWRRKLVLSPSLRPTRKQVMTLRTTRQAISAKDGWFGQEHLFDRGAKAVNVPLVERLLSSFRANARADSLDPRKQHRSALVPLKAIHELLAEWGAIKQDADRLLGVSLLVGRLLEENVTSDCRLVFMDGIESLEGKLRRRRARKQLKDSTMTVNIFQGRARRGGYPGDRAICDPELVTLQLHVLDLEERDGKPWGEGIPAIAVHLPREATTLVLQD